MLKKLSLLSQLALLCSAQISIPDPDASWPVTVKYQSPGSDGSCALSDASTLFVRASGLEGCNPTFNGNPSGYNSWYATCPAPAGDQWSISWFDDRSCSGDPALTEVGALGCRTNDKGQVEQFLCYSSFTESDIFESRGQFSVQIALFSTDDCADESFFMHEFNIPNKCISDGDSSRIYVPGTIMGVLEVYDNQNCSNAPADSTEVPVNYCFPYSSDPADGSILAWGKILSFDGTVVEAALPAATFEPSPAPVEPTLSSPESVPVAPNVPQPATTPTDSSAGSGHYWKGAWKGILRTLALLGFLF